MLGRGNDISLVLHTQLFFSPSKDGNINIGSNSFVILYPRHGIHMNLWKNLICFNEAVGLVRHDSLSGHFTAPPHSVNNSLSESRSARLQYTTLYVH